MSKYTNYLTFLNQNLFTVSTSAEDFSKNNEITFICPLEHSTTLKSTTFSNKKSTVEDPSHLCTTCFTTKKMEETLKLFQEEIINLNGHIVTSIIDTKNITYKCGNCDNEHKTTIANLRKNKGYCNSCQNDKNRNSYEKISNDIHDFGFKLLWTPLEFSSIYKHKDNPMSVMCPCGRDTEMRFHDIKAGKRCMGCRNERIQSTSIEKYGVSNPSMSSEVKSKIVSTNMKKYGVEYPQQNAEILQKTKAKCQEKFGKNFAFNQDWVYEKIRNTHKENWGVRFPLQNKVIQAKIDSTCLRKYNVRRPFLCSLIVDKIKKIMIEKYGSEFFFSSTSFSKVMMEKYGSHYALQIPEFFHKAMKSSFSKKNYIFPSGRSEDVMGYEPYVLDYLLKKTHEDDIFVGDKVPTFDYTDENGKRRKYYPDIFVIVDKIIEVKSTWTFNMCPLTIFAKMTEVARKGFISELVMVHKKRVWDTITYTTDKASSSRHRNWNGKTSYPIEAGDEPSDEDTDLMVDEVLKEDIEECLLPYIGEIISEISDDNHSIGSSSDL